MAQYVLPNIATGGSITVDAPDLNSAQQSAAQQTGVSLQQQQSGGTFGANTNSSISGAGGSSAPAAVGGAPQAGGGFDWGSYYNAITQSNQQNFELQKQAAQDAHDKAVLDLQLAKNSDQRSQALLNLQQAQQQLATLQFQEQQSQFAQTHGLDVQRFQEQQSEFGQTHGLDLQRLQEQQAEFQQGQYSDLAKNLLNTASQLRGPADWAQYVNYTNGGKNLMQTLFGSTPNPAYQTPGGYSNPITVGNVLSDLGMTNGAPSSTTPMSNVPQANQVNPAVWDSLSPSAQQLTLGLAQSGYTPTGVVNPDDYLKGVNASRPAGAATPSTTFNYPKFGASSF